MSIRQKNQEYKKAATPPTEEDLETNSNATIMMALANLTALVTGIQADVSKRLDGVLITQEESFRQFSGHMNRALEEQIETATLAISRNVEQ